MIMCKKKKWLSSIFPVFLLLLSACSAKENTVAEKPVKIALTQDILSFDPMLTSDIFSEAVLRCVYTSLYDFDEDLKLRPKLAKSSTVIDDKTWLIEIHDNVKFHDGSSLTAEDVIFSIERGMTGGRTEKLYEMLERVEFVDDTSFKLYTKEPYTDFLTVFAKAETSIVSKKVVSKEGYDFTSPIGAGPFKLLKRSEGKKIALERFDNCYLGKAASQYLDFLVIVTEQERTSSFLNGDVDILFTVSAYDCEKLRLSENVNLMQTPSTKIEYLSLNTEHPPLDDARVRLAISYAINRDNIVSGVYHGYATASSSTIPNGITGYTKSPVEYNPERARELLREAGYESGFSFDVITIDTIRKNTLEYIKLDLAQVGIELNYNLVTMQQAVDLMMAGEHDSILVGWAFNSDPNSVLPLLLGSGSGKTMNSSNYSNPKVDELLLRGRLEPSKEEKERIYEEINQLVTTDAPIVVLLNPMISSAARSDIAGAQVNAQGLFDYEKIHRK